MNSQYKNPLRNQGNDTCLVERFFFGKKEFCLLNVIPKLPNIFLHDAYYIIDYNRLIIYIVSQTYAYVHNYRHCVTFNICMYTSAGAEFSNKNSLGSVIQRKV